MRADDFARLVKQVALGKRVGGDVYVHVAALPLLPPRLRRLVKDGVKNEQEDGFNVVKLHGRAPRVSFLSYPGFFDEAFPSLAESITVDLGTKARRRRVYSGTDNPPVLHRKETLLPPRHPDVARFRALTEAAEQAGLFESSRTIGRKQAWERALRDHGYQLDGHHLRQVGAPRASDGPSGLPAKAGVTVARYRTAIKRHGLSVPVQTLADHGFLDGQYTIFDYGCGRGDDVRILVANGLEALGWDPSYRPDAAHQEADIVNLGFVLNVIERPAERREALSRAFGLARRVLVASVMIAGRATIEQFAEFGDGVLTKRNTFQKYFSQNEFRDYLHEELGVQPVAVGPGVFYVFRDAFDEQLFLLERQKARRRPLFHIPDDTGEGAHERRRAVLETNKDLLTAYWQRCLDLGRQAKPAEFNDSLEVQRLFGSYKHAFAFLLDYFGADELQRARQARADDLLVYFALREFERRKAYNQLPDVLKRDVKEHFGGYGAAKAAATELLFSCGHPGVIAAACERAHASGIGHLDAGHSLYLHSAQINELPAVLRVYIGCATQLYGDAQRADLVKLHMTSGKVSLMVYDDFDGKAIPLLLERIKVRLRDQAIDFYNYSGQYLPQPLYLKSKFLPDDHPARDAQQAFDHALQATGLLDLSGFGPDLRHLEATLSANRLKIEGFRLVRG